MNPELFCVEQVAERLGLHVKTVRGYVREGRLKAVRIGKQYRISRADLETFTGRPVGPAPRDTVRRERHVEVSSVVQIDAVSPELANRLTNGLIGAAKGRPDEDGPVGIQTSYNPERATMKVIVVGGMRANIEIFQMIGTLMENGK